MSPDTDLIDVPASGVSSPPLQRLRASLGARLRLPAQDDVPPPSARLLLLSFWAAACVFTGLIPAGRLGIAILFGSPGWYPPVAFALGLAGTAMVVAAFGSVHRAHLPWYLLGVATVLLSANVTLIYTLP